MLLCYFGLMLQVAAFRAMVNILTRYPILSDSLMVRWYIYYTRQYLSQSTTIVLLFMFPVFNIFRSTHALNKLLIIVMLTVLSYAAETNSLSSLLFELFALYTLI